MGHCTLVQAPTGYTYYHWDAAGNMTLAEPPAGVVTFMLDAERRRVGKTSIDGSSPASSTMPSACCKYEAGSGTNLYYQYDAQASTEMLSDDAGNVLGPYAYQAFGLIANASMSGWADLTPDLWASMGADDWGSCRWGRRATSRATSRPSGRTGRTWTPAYDEFMLQKPFGSQLYALDEIVAEKLALKRVSGYLGRLSPQQVAASTRYIEGMRDAFLGSMTLP